MSKDLVAYIKQQILSGELNPGDRIVETKLAKELGISQTPVREALRELQGEGIIMVVPNRGPLVCSLDMNDAFEIYSLRSMLEGLAMRLVVTNADDEQIAAIESIYNKMKDKVHDDSVDYLLGDSAQIHEMIIRLSGHSRIISSYESISFQIALLNRLVGTKKSKLDEIGQHEELIVALKQRDPDEAERTIRLHIYRSFCDFVQFNDLSRDPAHHDVKSWL